jgi:mycoredoxin
MTDAITMYSTTWCGHCRRLKRQLDEAGIALEVVELDEQPSDAVDTAIMARTGGYRTVPTLVVGEVLLVNPSLEQVKAALAVA